MTNHWDFSTKQTGSARQCYQESTFSFVCNQILNFNLICCISGAGTKCWKLRCFQFNIFIWVIYVDACAVHVCACVQPNLLPCLYDWIRSDVEEEGQSLGDKLPFFSAPPSPSSPSLSAVMRFTVELQSSPYSPYAAVLIVVDRSSKHRLHDAESSKLSLWVRSQGFTQAALVDNLYLSALEGRLCNLGWQGRASIKLGWLQNTEWGTEGWGSFGRVCWECVQQKNREVVQGPRCGWHFWRAVTTH